MYFYSCILNMKPISNNEDKAYSTVLQAVEVFKESGQSGNMKH